MGVEREELERGGGVGREEAGGGGGVERGKVE